MTKQNKLQYSVFLIKKEYTEFDDIIEENKYMEKREIKNAGAIEGYFYIGNNNENEPDWYKIMKGNIESAPTIHNKSTRAVLLIKIEGSFFAFTFGHGRYMLCKESYVRNFGLKIVLNNCEANKLKIMDTLTLDNVPAQTRTQTSKASELADFDIDNKRELLKGIEAEARSYNKYSKKISGRDAFYFTGKPYIHQLQEYCKSLLKDYSSNKYKKDFKWIDHVSEVTDPDDLEGLNKHLIHHLNQVIQHKTTPSVYLSPEEILDIERLVTFSYTEKGERFDELNLEEYIKVKKRNEIDLKKLKSDKAFVIDIASDDIINSWSIYNLINMEVKQDDTHYILALGSWYVVDKNYINNINKTISQVEVCPLDFHDFNHESEGVYNKSVAEKNSNIISMDKENFYVQDGKYEFCDLMSDKQHFIHVKRWNSSATLSHLFAQGRVSASAILNMPDQVAKINEKIPINGGDDSFILEESTDKHRDYTVVYAIIYENDKEIHERLPFFSKINFVHSLEALKGMQFNVQKMHIKDVSKKK